MTLCNMVIEGGGKNGVVAADKTTYAYLEVHLPSPLATAVLCSCLTPGCDPGCRIQGKTTLVEEPVFTDGGARYKCDPPRLPPTHPPLTCSSAAWGGGQFPQRVSLRRVQTGASGCQGALSSPACHRLPSPAIACTWLTLILSSCSLTPRTTEQQRASARAPRSIAPTSGRAQEGRRRILWPRLKCSMHR